MHRSSPALLICVLASFAVPASGDEAVRSWRGKVGVFIPTESGMDTGFAVGVERVLRPPADSKETVAELDYARTGAGGVNAHLFYLLYTQRMIGERGTYWGWGAGLSQLSASGGGASESRTDFAWQVCGGIQRRGQWYELRYASGQRNGNTGFLLTAAAAF